MKHVEKVREVLDEHPEESEHIMVVVDPMKTRPTEWADIPRSRFILIPTATIAEATHFLESCSRELSGQDVTVIAPSDLGLFEDEVSPAAEDRYADALILIDNVHYY